MVRETGMFEVTHFLCCFSLRTGCFTIGALQMIVGALCMTYAGLTINLNNPYMRMFYASIGMGLFHWIMAPLLVYGSYKGKAQYLKIWFVVSVILVAGLVMALFFYESFLIFNFPSAIMVYCMVVVRSYRNVLLETKVENKENFVLSVSKDDLPSKDKKSFDNKKISV